MLFFSVGKRTFKVANVWRGKGGGGEWGGAKDADAGYILGHFQVGWDSFAKWEGIT